jgi:hypothetical protein
MKIFESAKIVGTQFDTDAYHAFQLVAGAKRGDATFTLSRSEIMEFARCPSRWLAGYESPESEAKEYGALVDCLVLDYGAFERKYAVCPSTYTNDKGEEKPWNFNATICKEWREQQVGKITVKFEERAGALIARKTLLDCLPVADLLKNSDKQVFVLGYYHDKATELTVAVKALIDIVPDSESKRWGRCLADFKTARSGSPDKHVKDVFTYNYDAQSAIYTDLFNEATGDERETFIHVLQENFPPYHVTMPLPALSVEFVQTGRMKYLNALRLYAQCLKANQWPSYPSAHLSFGDFQFIEPLPWHIEAANQRPVKFEEENEPDEQPVSEMPS